MGATSLACIQFPNVEQPIVDFESAFPANAANNGAASEPTGFPATRQGGSFLGASIITDVTGSGHDSVIEGGRLLGRQQVAFSPTGAQESGFPKFTAGWDIYAPECG